MEEYLLLGERTSELMKRKMSQLLRSLSSFEVNRVLEVNQAGPLPTGRVTLLLLELSEQPYL